MLTEPVDGFTEVLPAVVAEVIAKLGLRVEKHDAARVYGLARTDPAARQTFMTIGFPFQILMTHMELSSSPTLRLPIGRAD